MKTISRLNPESRRGLLDFSMSVDFWESVPHVDEWVVRTGRPDLLQFPMLHEGGSAPDFFGGLLKGILLYDELLWDASFLERDIMVAPSGLDEWGKRHDRMAKSAAVCHVIELMEEGLIVPHCGHVGLTEDQELAIDRHAVELARDDVMQDIVKGWDYEDIDDAGWALPVFIQALLFSQRYNASVISRSHEQELYDRILWQSSKKMTDKYVQNSLKEVLSVSIPTYHLSTVDQLVSLKRENCVRHFREKVWSIFRSRMNNPDQSSFELVRELDSDRENLSDAMQTISQMKLAWSIVTILVSPVFSVLPFPLSFGAPAISLATREAIAAFMEKRQKRKYAWIFAIDKVRRLFVPWERNRARAGLPFSP